MRRSVLVALAIAPLAGGCGGTHSHVAGSAAAIGVNGRRIGSLSTPGTPKGEQTVHVLVVAKTGPQRAAMALVPVYIDERGPYPFALDTGASSSLISATLAHQLHLAAQSPATTIHGITGAGRAYQVRLGNWRAGRVPLPPSLIDAMLPREGGESGGEPPAHGRRRAGPAGLLGSDVLSRYGKIAVDYDRGLLILDPPVR
jgi:Aspartyl protease